MTTPPTHQPTHSPTNSALCWLVSIGEVSEANWQTAIASSIPKKGTAIAKKTSGSRSTGATGGALSAYKGSYGEGHYEALSNAAITIGLPKLLTIPRKAGEAWTSLTTEFGKSPVWDGYAKPGMQAVKSRYQQMMATHAEAEKTAAQDTGSAQRVTQCVL